MRALEHIWKVPAYLPYLQPKLTAAAVRRAEQRLGVKLPPSYVSLLEVQNGGYVRCSLDDEAIAHSMIYGIGPSFPSITRDPSWRMLDDDMMPREEHRLVPFDGDGHWYLCLDYRGGRTEPAIVVIDLELERDRRVATSFDAFLRKLVPRHEPGTLGVVGAIGLEDGVAALAKSLRVTFEPPDASDRGFPIARAQVKKQPPEWIWVGENRVPRGFARKGERNYRERNTLLPGTALRFPDRPEVSLIVSCTDGVVERVRKACKRAGMTTARL